MIDIKYIKPVQYILPLLYELKFRFLRKNFTKYWAIGVAEACKTWSNILSGSVKIGSAEDKSRHILFVTGYGLGSHYLGVEPIIWHALRANGAKVSSIYCNKAIECCELNITGNSKKNLPFIYWRGLSTKTSSAQCDTCCQNLNKIYDACEVESYALNRFLTEEDYEIADRLSSAVSFEEFRKFTFDEILVGEEVYATILRATFMGGIENTALFLQLIRRYTRAGILTCIGYKKAFGQLRPDRVVCIHGVYQTHGLAVKVAKRLQIPVIVIGGGGIRKHTAILCHGETYHHQLVNEDNKIWAGKELSAEQRNKVLLYASNKQTNGAGVDYLNYHPNPINDKNYLFEKFKIDDKRGIVAIYTNVIWDAQIFYGGNVFSSIYDWINFSINELAKNQDIWVLIRIHPAEVKGANKTRQPMIDEIRRLFPVIPPNIRIIPPESNFSSYTLAQMADVNIIYGTKMGLEIALMKKILIVCGESFSRNKGYGIDITSKDQYRKILSNLKEISYKPELYENALRYAHYLYYQRMIDLPFRDNQDFKSTSAIELNFKSIEDLKLNKNLTVIANGILNLEPFTLQV